MFGKQSTRDIAVENRSLTLAHIEECKREREITRGAIESVQADLDKKHRENLIDRQKDRDDFAQFQKKLLLIAILFFASIALKGTHLDLLSAWLSGL